MSNQDSRPLKRIVVKEEFVALTKDFQVAVVLGQLEYWQKRVKEIDQYIAEEQRRCQKEGIKFTANPTDGWIYKTASQLTDECMLGCSDQTMGRLIDRLVKSQWVLKRKNPKFRWDQTIQYRLNLPKIKEDLHALGFELSDWKLTLDESPISKMENASSKMELGFSTLENVEEQRLLTETTNRSKNIYCAPDRENPNVGKIINIRKTTKKEEADLEEKFSQFWELYPQKRSKQAALKVFKRLIEENPPLFGIIMNALHSQNRERARRLELGLFTPEPKHPTTWLNQECWTDVTKTEEELNEEHNRNRTRGSSKHQLAQRGSQKLDAHISELAKRVQRGGIYVGDSNHLDI